MQDCVPRSHLMIKFFSLELAISLATNLQLQRQLGIQHCKLLLYDDEESFQIQELVETQKKRRQP
jgi:hypothetical protein